MSFSPEQFEEMSNRLAEVREEIGKFIVGQQEAVEFSLYAILADGHALLGRAARLRKDDVDPNHIRSIGLVFFSNSIYTGSHAGRYYRNEYFGTESGRGSTICIQRRTDIQPNGVGG